MLGFEFATPINSNLSFVLTFYIKKKDEYCEVAKFRFNSKAFGSVEKALSLFASLANNNFLINASFGYMLVHTNKVVCDDNISDVVGYAEVKNPGDPFDKYLNVDLYYSDSITVDEIYKVIDEVLDIKSFKSNVKQLFDY